MRGLVDVRAVTAAASFGAFVADAAAAGQLVVQPRMGFSDPDRMRHGLQRTKFAAACTVGTLTLDSYTRLGDHAAVRGALAEGIRLNGYPIVDQPAGVTRALEIWRTDVDRTRRRRGCAEMAALDRSDGGGPSN